MLLTYQYRLLPSRQQHRALEALLESQRQLYNAALEERIDAYIKAGLTRSYMDQTRALTEWRHSDPEAAAYPLCLQRGTLKRVDRAYAGFFRRLKGGGKPGFPRFRGRGRFDSFAFSEYEGITLHASRLRFKSMPGRLKIHFHRPFPTDASVRAVAFRRTPKGWFVSFALAVPIVQARGVHRAVGIDLGISTFAALSDGGNIPSLRAARKAERRLRLVRRALSRCKVGSRSRRKARNQVARCYQQEVRARAEHLHQASARIVRDYDFIALERLNVGGLAGSILAKDVKDASWAKFIAMLRYKAEKAGAQLVEVDPRNTSQECSGCMRTVKKTLADRVHDCPYCGLVIDRDLNAARNVLRRAGVGPGLLNVAVKASVQAETSSQSRRVPAGVTRHCPGPWFELGG